MSINVNHEKQPAATERVSRSFKLGAMSVTQLLDMTAIADGPKEEYAADVPDEEFARVSRKNFISSDEVQVYMTPTLIDTGKERVLIDTGLGYGGLNQTLQQADISPDSIDVVILSHMHPDHIGGLMTKGQPTFANARYIAGSVEYNVWSKMETGNIVGDLVAQKVTPLAEKTTFIDPGETGVSGITALESFGHSPGHFCLHVESEGQRMVMIADLANHYVWSFAQPDWAFKFDDDKQAAKKSRGKVLSMLAADKIPMIGYHMPFPGIGFVESHGKGFRYVPASYQFGR